MKFLAHLEKEKYTWLLIGLCTIFFFLRLPSIIEPYWYGDEGVYEVIGQAMNHGQLLYRDIWDNKPPLLYLLYAIAQGDQQIVKIISILAGEVSIVVFFLLSRKLFKKLPLSIITTILFVLFLATPLLEANIANAEVFILPFVILPALILYQFVNKDTHKPNKFTALSAGFLLGIAFLFKTVAIFDFMAFFLFIVMSNFPEKISWSLLKKSHKHTFKNILPQGEFVILGFSLPLTVTILYFVAHHAFANFLQAVFLENINYVGYANMVQGLPFGLLSIKFLLLLLSVILIFWKRTKMSPPTRFILLWTLFSLFNAFFSERPYTHYVITLLPSFCMIIGLFFASKKIKTRFSLASGVLFISIITSIQFNFNWTKSYTYYPNAIQFITGKETVEAYQSFFDTKTPRDYAIASFIRKNTSSLHDVFIWGNSPQIYALSHTLPLGEYTVAYHIIQNNGYKQTQQMLNKEKPKYIIALNDLQPLPFYVPLYIMRYTIPGAIIYERNL